MKPKLIILIVVAILLIIFALQNAGEVLVNFFGIEFKGSLSLFLILGILIGAILGSLFTVSLKKAEKKPLEDKKADVAPSSDNKVVSKG